MSEKLEPNLEKLLIDESKTICPHKVANDKKTGSDHNGFIFNMYMKSNKKITIVKKKHTHNGDLQKRNLQKN